MKTVAVDTGGTFTDLVVMDQDTGELEVLKVPSSPADPGQAIAEGMRELFPTSEAMKDVGALAHGTTVGTNILVQGKGARVGLLVTQGFTGINDVWQVPRPGHELGDIYEEKRPPVASRLCKEVPERVDSHGSVKTPLDAAAATEAVRDLRRAGVESVAVALLFSFLNPAHERELARIIQREFPEAWVSLSSEVLPQVREYPRLSTTVANARLAPSMTAYLTSLAARLREQGVAAKQLYVMQSNGGVAKLESVVPVTTILSGPCAGALAGVQIAALAGDRDVVTLDMGGTSTDIALAEQGVILEQTSGLVGDWEIGVPMLMINTIGAGGGTVAWLDKGGGLQVGPQSAGADPGPVCYGKGGVQPTVTDANLVLGYLNPQQLGGGKVALDRDRAYNALEKLGRQLGMTALQAAEGIIRIVNANMEEGIRAVSTERGHDLREFALAAFGGAGPVPAGRLAADLGMRRVIVPPAPGVTSALGLLMADPRRDHVASRLQDLAALGAADANAVFDALKEQARRGFMSDGFRRDQVRVSCSLDLRYQGQGYELNVPVGQGDRPLSDADLEAARRRFDDDHKRLFGHSAPTEPVEVVNYRVRAEAEVRHAALKPSPETISSSETARIGTRDACFDAAQGMTPTPVYDRNRLVTGNVLNGPAIVEQLDSTTVVYPGQRAKVDAYRNIIIEPHSAEDGHGQR